ncbi:MAG: DUF6320 domain-containing protein [Lachnospiraceae bacterium]|nr:DUF6320 domain-containing protein [Lachnospiraceae bacterium]
MSKCWNCGIELKDPHHVCPLCKCIVERDETEEPVQLYPFLNAERGIRKMQRALNIYLFSAIVLEVLLAGIDYRAQGRPGWVILIGVFLVGGYVTLRVLVSLRAAYRLKLILLAMLGVAILVAIDIETGFAGWSLNYVLPGVFILMDLMFVALMVVNSREWQSYIPMQILIIALSCIQFVLYYLGLVTRLGGCVLSLTAAILFFAGTMIVGGSRARAELYRRFHV